MAFCSDCGEALKVKDKFCSNCGNQRDVAVFVAPDETNKEDLTSNEIETDNSFLKSVIALATITAMVLGVVFYFTHKESSKNPLTPTDNRIYLVTDAYDGQFSFTVTAKPKCGIASVGDYLPLSATEQFCSIRMLVKNISNKPGTFFDSNQKVYDTQKNEYSISPEADIYASGALSVSTINPGERVFGDIYVDVPKGTNLSYIELHDSAFSGGVKVYLQDNPALVAQVNSDIAKSTYPKIKDGLYFQWDESQPCPSKSNDCIMGHIMVSKNCSKGVNVRFSMLDESGNRIEVGEEFSGNITKNSPMGLDFEGITDGKAVRKSGESITQFLARISPKVESAKCI